MREGIDENCGRNDAFKYFRRLPLLQKFTKSYQQVNILHNKAYFRSISTTTSANNSQTLRYSFVSMLITFAVVLL